MTALSILAIVLAIEANYSPQTAINVEWKNPVEPLVLLDCGGEIGRVEYTPYSKSALEVPI